MFQLPSTWGDSLKTKPQPPPQPPKHAAPLPPIAVPQRLPASSKVSPAQGEVQSAPPVKLRSTASLQVPSELGASLKTTPDPSNPPRPVVP
jgi:hypothetical protein